MNEQRPGIGQMGHGGASTPGAGAAANHGTIHPPVSPPPMHPPHAPTAVAAPARIPAAAPAAVPAHAPAAAVPAAPARAAHAPKNDEPLTLDGEEHTAEEVKSKIHGITGMASSTSGHHEFKRPTHANNSGAVRMRTFHCRLSEQGVETLDQNINAWLDQHPDFEVKFSTSTVGQWDGKLKEPTLIVNVWY